MRRLGTTVKDLLPDLKALGGGSRNIDRGRLIKVLGELAGELRMAYWLRIALIALIIGVLVAVSLRFADQQAILSGLYGGVGITFAGAIAALKQVSDEMARVRLLLSIAPELSVETLTEIARHLAADL